MHRESPARVTLIRHYIITDLTESVGEVLLDTRVALFLPIVPRFNEVWAIVPNFTRGQQALPGPEIGRFAQTG